MHSNTKQKQQGIMTTLAGACTVGMESAFQDFLLSHVTVTFSVTPHDSSPPTPIQLLHLRITHTHTQPHNHTTTTPQHTHTHTHTTTTPTTTTTQQQHTPSPHHTTHTTTSSTPDLSLVGLGVHVGPRVQQLSLERLQVERMLRAQLHHPHVTQPQDALRQRLQIVRGHDVGEFCDLLTGQAAPSAGHRSLSH